MDFIRNRTQADLEYIAILKEKLANGTASIQEKAEWRAATLRGAYNYTDLNRVANDVIELRDRGIAEGLIIVLPATPKTDWTVGDIPTTQQMTDYLNNVITIATAYSISTASLPTTMVGLTITGANAIEDVLYQASLIDLTVRLITSDDEYLVNENNEILTT